MDAAELHDESYDSSLDDWYGDEDLFEVPTGADHWVLAVYTVDRQYGGPEEGGWWYTIEELARVHGGYATEDAAYQAASDLREAWEVLEEDRGGLSLRVFGLGRTELRPELAANSCHDGYSYGPSDYIRRWDIPEYLPEHRPHYC